MEEEDDTLMVAQDYNSAMVEIERQKANIRQWKMQRKLQQQEEEQAARMAEQESEEEETIDQLQVGGAWCLRGVPIMSCCR